METKFKRSIFLTIYFYAWLLLSYGFGMMVYLLVSGGSDLGGTNTIYNVRVIILSIIAPILIIYLFVNFWYIMTSKESISIINLFIKFKSRTFSYDDVKLIIISANDYRPHLFPFNISVITNSDTTPKQIMLTLLGEQQVIDLVKELKFKNVNIDISKLPDDIKIKLYRN